MEKKINELFSKVSVVTQKTEELNNSIILIKNYIECQQRLSSVHVIPSQHVMTPPDALTPTQHVISSQHVIPTQHVIPAQHVIPTQHVMTPTSTHPPVISRYNR